MRACLAALVVVLAAIRPATAVDSATCDVATHLVSPDFPLPRVTEAIANKHLNILVIGTASSTLGDPTGHKQAYPGRLEAALASKLPGVTVNVTTLAKPRELASQVERELPRTLASYKPALVIWQTGTVEAMRRVDIDDFTAALNDGVDQIEATKSDTILMNMQYSPRTELIIAVSPYADAMRFVALQHGILLFDRFAIMKHWGEMGTFDLNEVTKKIDTAAQVHDCIGRLLGDLIVDAGNTSKKPTGQ